MKVRIRNNMNKLEEIGLKINADQEVLTTLPQNNAKNQKIYFEKVDEIKEEYNKYKEEMLKEMESRYKQAIKVPKDNEIGENLQKIKNSIIYHRELFLVIIS